MLKNDSSPRPPPPEVIVRAPEFGAPATTLRIGCWFADVDDEIQAGTSLLELITPGIRVEIDVPVTGRLSRIERYAGSSVEPGAILGTITPANSAQTDSSEPS